MIKNAIKLTHNTLGYYELQVSSQVTVEQIKLKLSDFNQLRQEDDSLIILSFTDDCSNILQIESLVKLVRQCALLHQVEIIAIRSMPAINQALIDGISVVRLPSAKRPKPLNSKTLYIDSPIRSGATIYNNGDIIIANFVSNGAEIVASGNIHIYGELRGRVIAGSDGDKSARIFVTKFNPELIAVGGIYRAIDTKLPDNLLNKFVVVSLDDKDRLNISAVN
jgi:septum site-determining protein MinC